VKRFFVDCRGISSFEDFVTAMNQGFIGPIGGQWDGNLDALNDYLAWPDENEYELEIIDSDSCSAVLGCDAMANRLKHGLAHCHPSNAARLRREVAAAETGKGGTLFDLIREIISNNDHVHLILT
jgi:hypothetical protein